MAASGGNFSQQLLALPPPCHSTETIMQDWMLQRIMPGNQLLCNVCQMSFAPSASRFSIPIFSDKSCDGAAGGPTAGQVLVVSCRAPAGSPGLWQGLGRSAQGSAPSFLQGSAWLIALRWETVFYLQKSASKWVIFVYFWFWGRERICQTWEGITTSSLKHRFPFLWMKRIILCNRNNSSSPPACEPPMHQRWLRFYPAAAAGHIPGLHAGISNPSAL